MALEQRYDPGLSQGLKILTSSIQGYGLPLQLGNIWYVNPTTGSDANTGNTPDTAVATLAQAYANATSNNNDIIVLSGYADHPVTAQIAWTKSRIHVFGTGNHGAFTDFSSKVVMGVTTAATDVDMIHVTGTRNTFNNIKFINNNTLSGCLTTVYDGGGEGNVYNNCAFQMNVQLNQTTVFDAILNTDSCTFNNCEFGNDLVVRSVARHTVSIGTVALPFKSNYFNNCTFKSCSTSTSTVHIVTGTGNSVTFDSVFRGCCFIASQESSGVANTVNISTSTTISGHLIFDQNTFTGVGTKMAASTANTGVWITSPSTPTAATSGVAVLAA